MFKSKGHNIYFIFGKTCYMHVRASQSHLRILMVSTQVCEKRRIQLSHIVRVNAQSATSIKKKIRLICEPSGVYQPRDQPQLPWQKFDNSRRTSALTLIRGSCILLRQSSVSCLFTGPCQQALILEKEKKHIK